MASNSVNRLNQIVLLLRQQLSGRAGRSAPQTSGTARPRASSEKRPGTPLQSVSVHIQALRAAGVINPVVLQRAFVERLLLSGFGEHLLNDAGFQAVVDEVLRTLLEDPAMAGMLDAAITPSGSREPPAKPISGPR